MALPPGVRRLFAALPGSRGRLAADVDDELAFHLDMCARDLAARGLDPATARLEAARRFGDLAFTRDYCRDEDRRRDREERQAMNVGELRQDLSYALRALRAARGFTVVALLTLAIGIGATAAVYGVVRGVLLRPLPFPDADRVVRIWSHDRTSDDSRVPLSEPDFLDMREGARSVEAMGSYFYREEGSATDLVGDGPAERIQGAYISSGFFPALRVSAALGRVTRDEEHVAGNDRVMVLSHGFWQRRYGGDPAIVGRQLRIDGELHTVIGVMAENFTFPAERLDFWMPLSRIDSTGIPRTRFVRFLDVIGRLRPGVTPEQAQRELSGIAESLSQRFPDNANYDAVAMIPVRESIVGPVERPLLLLMAAVGFVLLITCANVAGLLLARSTVRERELTVRAALGAGRGRIVRQLLTENLVLALAGGLLGIGVAWFGVKLLVSLGAADLPRASEVRLDAGVLAFALLASVAAAVLFGVLPALRTAKVDLRSGLTASRGVVGSGGQRLRSALVVAEVALAFVLVVGAGLATQSFVRLLRVDPGFRPANVLVVRLSLEGGPQRAAQLTQLIESFSRMPGVTAVGTVKDAPFRGIGEPYPFTVAGIRGPEPDGAFRALVHHTSPGFFRAAGIPLKDGRDLAFSDNGETPLVAVVNESLVKRVWQGENPVGRAMTIGGTPVQVVGIVGDVHQRGFDVAPEPMVYVNQLQWGRSGITFLLRTSGDPLTVAGAVRGAVTDFDPNQTITNITTYDDVVRTAVSRPRMLATLLAIFAAIGLVLGALGIYGVLAFAVSRRRQEIGVRVALGATPSSVMRMVVGQGLRLAAIGVVLGLAGALWVTRSMQTLLFEVQPGDPMTLAAVIVSLVAVALVASTIPALRALRIDPGIAMRAE